MSHYLTGEAYRRATARRLALTSYSRLRREAGLDPPLRFRFGGSFCGPDELEDYYESQDAPFRGERTGDRKPKLRI